MIALHHGGRSHERFYLNPDLIRTVENRPDTIIALTDGQQVWVDETADEVAAAIRDWRAGVLQRATELTSEETNHG